MKEWYNLTKFFVFVAPILRHCHRNRLMVLAQWLTTRLPILRSRVRILALLWQGHNPVPLDISIKSNRKHHKTVLYSKSNKNMVGRLFGWFFIVFGRFFNRNIWSPWWWRKKFNNYDTCASDSLNVQLVLRRISSGKLELLVGGGLIPQVHCSCVVAICYIAQVVSTRCFNEIAAIWVIYFRTF